LAVTRSLYGDLEFPEPPAERPYTYANMAMTLDGKVAVGNRGYLLTGSPADRRAMDELRASADAVMVGAGTIRLDNPPLRVRSDDLRRRRVLAGLPEDPIPVVVSRSCSVSPSAKAFSTAGAVVVTCAEAPADRRDALAKAARMLICGQESVDLTAAAAVLRKELGVRRLLVEGGPNLIFSLLRDGLLDELFVTVAPLIKGGRDTPTLVEGDGFAYPRMPRLTLVSLCEDNGELFLRYRVLRSEGKQLVPGRCGGHSDV